MLSFTATMQQGTVTKRYLHIDSNLVPVVDGAITVAIPDQYAQVSRITLREALIPRTDDLLYVLLGIGLNGGDRPSLMQLGANPNAARSQNSNTSMAPNYYSVTKVTPHLPVFCQLPIGDATSVAGLDANALNVSYSFIDHRMDDMWSYAIQPPVRSLNTLKLQLYRPPDPASTWDLPVYDISVFKITFAAPVTCPPGTDITSKPVTEQLPQPEDFTATVLAIDPANAANVLVGSFSSLTAFQAFVTRTAEDGVTTSEQTLFTADTAGAPVGLVSSPAQVTSLATRVLITLELVCNA